MINVGLVGSEQDLMCAMSAAGWSPSDPVTLESSMRIAGSVVFHRPYRGAPVSPLYFDGRRQDYAFEKEPARQRPDAPSRALLEGVGQGRRGGGRRGSARRCSTTASGISHYTGQITHHTAADIDAERDYLIHDLVDAKRVTNTYSVSGVGPTLFGRNGGGDAFYTDGEIAFAELAPGCETREAAAAAQAPPPRIAAKNAVFSWLAGFRRRLL